MSNPSIFNDVIGPVMRGPSSSHCAAAVRIGHVGRAIMADQIETVLVQFDKTGSLAATHTSQGSDMGLCGGLLGFFADDDRLIAFEDHMKKNNIKIEYVVGDFKDPHPNTYRITLRNSCESHFIIALSTGGGMFEVTQLDGVDISIKGDCHVTLIFFKGDEGGITDTLKKSGLPMEIAIKTSGDTAFIEVKSWEKPGRDLVETISKFGNVSSIRWIPPVLPILTPKQIALPFENISQLFDFNKEKDLNLAELALVYESARGAVGQSEVLEKMVEIIHIMKASIRRGIDGTRYEDRILGRQSDKFLDSMGDGRIIDIGVLNRIILYITSLMEVKSSMGVIVAAPTAGSCGGLPGAIIGAAEEMGCNDEQAAQAMLAAGLIGVFITKFSTFAAEVGGCQAECGAGSGMAAAGLVTLMGGSARKAVAAASMALQNSFGMVCDPVANRVEVPCLGKNIMAASNAVSCANIALAGFDPVIPLDQVIDAMDKVGKSIHPDLRCTASGGLSLTPASISIQGKLLKP